ncbi:MAG: MOSC N-terminal beta barrel domain-containing protein, partial [Bdellovibrio sp.]
MNITSLHIYPLKSARAQIVKSFAMNESGPEGDRQWMLVDD